MGLGTHQEIKIKEEFNEVHKPVVKQAQCSKSWLLKKLTEQAQPQKDYSKKKLCKIQIYKKIRMKNKKLKMTQNLQRKKEKL